MDIKELLKKSFCFRKAQYYYVKTSVRLFGEKRWIVNRYKKKTGKNIDVDNPITLNEKIVWLKLFFWEEFYVKACDKYFIHNYLVEKLGNDYAPPLLFATQEISELKNENISQFPCIVKVSNGSGTNLIIHRKDQYSDSFLQKYFRTQVAIANMEVISTGEHQYLKTKPYIVVEKLLQDENNGIPNDYKFLYINGELQFVYCSVDRLGSNVRQVYDPAWNRLHFLWVYKADEEMFRKHDSSPSIKKPINYDKMCKLSKEIAEDFPLVRVDFYELGNEVYVGEITLHHGSGEDLFYPSQYDEYYGEKLILPKPNRSAKY